MIDLQDDPLARVPLGGFETLVTLWSSTVGNSAAGARSGWDTRIVGGASGVADSSL
ncbi:hypothetical protein ABZ759_32815 [Streptomyces sp. NPDC047860]|uniref:hypothetical protein n=1 Tax=Streptomyces sp. NPDC047860 TaxID=3155743 RepID=UPI003409E6C0